MSVALWRCELSVSRRAQQLLWLLYGAAIAALLLSAWPTGLAWIGLPLLAAVMLECRRSQRRVRRLHGALALLTDGQLRWRQQLWRQFSRPLITQQMIILSLRQVSGEKTRLWLFADSMQEQAWRRLRFHLLSAQP